MLSTAAAALPDYPGHGVVGADLSGVLDQAHLAAGQGGGSAIQAQVSGVWFLLPVDYPVEVYAPGEFTTQPVDGAGEPLNRTMTGMTTRDGWSEELHPRKPDGEFAHKGGAPGFAQTLSDRIGDQRGEPGPVATKILGPQGPYTSEPMWRSFPSSIDERYGNGNPLSAEDQVAASVDAVGGLGRWFGPSKMAEFYGDDGSVLVAVRFRPQDLARLHEPADVSGLVAPAGTNVAVVAMKVHRGGAWHGVSVPANLVAPTTEVHDW